MSSDTLVRITALANTLRTAQAAVVDATEALAAAKKMQTQIETEDLPELMRELGINGIELEDGSKVDVKEDLMCGISDANRAAAHEWIRARGDAGLIKTGLEVSFGRGEEEEAAKIAGEIQKLTNNPVNIEEGIHHSTLKAYIKELREKSVTVPPALFGLHVFNKAKLTPPKKAKAKK